MLRNLKNQIGWCTFSLCEILKNKFLTTCFWRSVENFGRFVGKSLNKFCCFIDLNNESRTTVIVKYRIFRLNGLWKFLIRFVFGTFTPLRQAVAFPQHTTLKPDFFSFSLFQNICALLLRKIDQTRNEWRILAFWFSKMTIITDTESRIK